MVAESLPECVEWERSILYDSWIILRVVAVMALGILAIRTGAVEPYIQFLDVAAYLGNDDLEFGSIMRMGFFVFLLEGEGGEAIFARFQIQAHGIVMVFQRLRCCTVVGILASNEFTLLIIYEHANSTYMIIEHVGTLHVVVVLELQVNSHIARGQVIVHQVVAAAEHAAESDDAAECCRAADSCQAVESPFHAYILDPTM